MRHPQVWLIGILLVASTSMSFALAQPRPRTKDANADSGKNSNASAPESSARKKGPSDGDGDESATARRRLPGMTAEREAAVMTFVRNYHPELADLLARLKTTSPRDFERAVVELFRTSERLAQIQEKQPERHALELELWKSQSRVQLLAARMSVSDGTDLRERLREALEHQLDVRRQLLMLERGRLRQRLEKLDEQILGLQQDQVRLVEQQIKALTRQSGVPAAVKDPKKGRDKPGASSGKPAATSAK